MAAAQDVSSLFANFNTCVKPTGLGRQAVSTVKDRTARRCLQDPAEGTPLAFQIILTLH